MELFLIFLLIAFCLFMIFISKTYSSRPMLIGPLIIFAFMGMNILQYGYEVPGPITSSAQANYTFNSSINTNQLTTLTVTNTQTLTNKLDWTSQVLGIFILASGFVLGILATGYA